MVVVAVAALGPRRVPHHCSDWQVHATWKKRFEYIIRKRLLKRSYPLYLAHMILLIDYQVPVIYLYI